MIGTEAFDRFVSENRWAVITTVRKSGQPSSSVVAYAREDDTIVVSTTAPTLKVRTLVLRDFAAAYERCSTTRRRSTS